MTVFETVRAAAGNAHDDINAQMVAINGQMVNPKSIKMKDIQESLAALASDERVISNLSEAEFNGIISTLSHVATLFDIQECYRAGYGIDDLLLREVAKLKEFQAAFRA